MRYRPLWCAASMMAALLLVACNTPMQSQQFFAKAVRDDPMLEPIHQTALYTVFYDHALRRCVLHSSYTWGESGGGTGGTGIGVSVFNCDPVRLKAHVEKLKRLKDEGVERFEFPAPRTKAATPPPASPRTAPPPAPTE